MKNLLGKAPFGWYSSHDFRVTKMSQLHNVYKWSITKCHVYLGNKSIEQTIKYIKGFERDIEYETLLIAESFESD